MSRNGKKGELRQSHRVLVVGGGPAGLASAITLAAAGVAVVVVEKGSWPLDKVCGEGILPTGVDFLQRFDVLSRLQADMSRPFHGIRYRNPGGVLVEADFQRGPGLGVRRVALSRALFESVRDNPWWNCCHTLGLLTSARTPMASTLLWRPNDRPKVRRPSAFS